MPRPNDVGVGTGVAICDPEGFVLLGERQGAHGEGLWSFPGGWIDRSDGSIDEAARREVEQETGIVLPPTRRLCEASTDFPSHGFRSITLFRHVMLDHRVQERLLEPKKCRQWRWWSLSGALPTDMFGGVQEALQTLAMRWEEHVKSRPPSIDEEARRLVADGWLSTSNRYFQIARIRPGNEPEDFLAPEALDSRIGDFIADLWEREKRFVMRSGELEGIVERRSLSLDLFTAFKKAGGRSA